MALGLLVSAFAYSEFQAVQFMPAIVMPQALLSGLIAPRAGMADWLQTISDVMPMTYSVEALMEVGLHKGVTETMLLDLAIILAVAVGALVLGSATLQRRTE
jgi:ABC-2 type transport system permease protein